MINIILHGCNGRMGQAVASAAAADPTVRIVAGVDKFPDAKNNNFPVYHSLEECSENADVIIDFSMPAALPLILDYAKKQNIPVVIATTGFSNDELDLITKTSNSIPIFRSANMSLGVNVMMELAQNAASVLGNLFDIEIIEQHHNQKLDSPSGTAYALADAINEALLNSKAYVYGRHSKHEKRSKTEIGIHAVRGGTIPGEHTVLFAGNDEVLKITHTAFSRQIFALGALRACKFITAKPPGLYGMKDMLTQQAAVTNISSSNREALVTINHIPSDSNSIALIFQTLADHNINIDMISQSAPIDRKVNISFSLPRKDLQMAIMAVNDLQPLLPSISMSTNGQIVKLSVEGMGMEHQPGVAARIFTIMAEQNIDIKAITTSETKVSYIIDKQDEKRALEALMEAFEL